MKTAVSPLARDVLAVLAEAMADQPIAPTRRVTAAADSRSTEEGLTLLGAYVSIEDPRIRQAILDAVLTISADRRGR